MDNPLAELEAWWEAAYDHGNTQTQLDVFATVGEGYRMEFETIDDAKARASWRLIVDGIEEVVWKGENGEPEWFENHVLLMPHDSTAAVISFGKPLTDPLRAWGAVAKAHRESVGGWFPLERFFRTSLIEGDFGELALGPVRLLAAYAEALRSVGENVGYLPLIEQVTDTPPSVVTWGTSYFVAEYFQLERL